MRRLHQGSEVTFKNDQNRVEATEVHGPDPLKKLPVVEPQREFVERMLKQARAYGRRQKYLRLRNIFLCSFVGSFIGSFSITYTHARGWW